jgi:penicillin-binding protein 1A
VTVGLVLYLAVDLATGTPGLHPLSTLSRMPEASIVHDAFDRPIFTIFREQRLRVPLDRMSPDLINAVLAIEDRRFYWHGGIDLVRVGGAALANLIAGRIVQGGSTITQQLARESLLSREKTFRRKLAEMMAAWRIEAAYRKPEILELYLNRIYFGAGLYGAEAAARGYFGKSAADLDLSEAALVAGLIQAPERYSPTKFPERALVRRDVVLAQMVETGAIDEAAVEAARRAPLVLNNGLRPSEGARYFEEEVRQQLITLFGVERVYEEGLRVYTTIDPSVQGAAEGAVARGLQQIDVRRGCRHARPGSAAPASRKPTGTDDLQAALIALDPRSGEVRAMVGGRSFAESPFNRAVQARRQPGSAFKPFVFAAALEAGLTPATLLRHLDDPLPTPRGDWLPADRHVDASELTVRRALRVSSNRAAVKLLALTGMNRTLDSLARFNLGPQPAVPSLALGPGEVTLQSLTAAYAAFANNGVVPRPIYIRRVEDTTGRVLFRAEVTGTRAVSPATAFQMATLLADVLDAGTGSRVRREGFALPAGGKTGTTDESVDAWFVGFTPSLAAGVWLGFDEPQTIVRNGYAADLAAPLWADFMKTVTRGAKPEWFQPPPEITSAEVCIVSGELATDQCRRARADASTRRVTYHEYFVRGTEPSTPCRVHRPALHRRLAGLFGGGRDGTSWGSGSAGARLPDGGGAGGEAERADRPAMRLRKRPAGEPPAGESGRPEANRKKAKKSVWRRLLRFGF